MVRYSACCQPVPGDEVIGYITRGRGISIHRIDCPNVLNLGEHPERRVEIEWEAESGERFFVRLVVEGDDRRGLLSDIATAISDTGTNIQSAEIKAVEGGMNGNFAVEVQDLTHLKKVMKSITPSERRDQCRAQRTLCRAGCRLIMVPLLDASPNAGYPARTMMIGLSSAMCMWLCTCRPSHKGEAGAKACMSPVDS